MYVKCGSMEDASRVFNKIPSHNVVTSNMMLFGHVKCGEREKALEPFQQKQQEGVQPDPFTFVGVLNACASVAALEEGRCAHEQIIPSGCESDLFVDSSLVDMCAKCGSMEDAWRAFNKMPSRNAVTWNSMIFGHVKCGEGEKALELFQQMQLDGMQPDPVTFVGMLNACASVAALEEGRCVNEQIIQSRCESDTFVGDSLVDLYVKCRSMEDSWRTFNKIPSQNGVTWNAMLLGHVKCGQGEKALELFRQMPQEGVQPDPVTFVGVLNACVSAVTLEEARCAHEQIIQSGFESDSFVGSSLVDMYAKCGSIEDARSVLNKTPSRNAVSWSAMLAGFAMHGHGNKALD